MRGVVAGSTVLGCGREGWVKLLLLLLMRVVVREEFGLGGSFGY
jgi:hypothetical protein